MQAAKAKAQVQAPAKGKPTDTDTVLNAVTDVLRGFIGAGMEKKTPVSAPAPAPAAPPMPRKKSWADQDAEADEDEEPEKPEEPEEDGGDEDGGTEADEDDAQEEKAKTKEPKEPEPEQEEESYEQNEKRRSVYVLKTHNTTLDTVQKIRADLVANLPADWKNKDANFGAILPHAPDKFSNQYVAVMHPDAAFELWDRAKARWSRENKWQMPSGMTIQVFVLKAQDYANWIDPTRTHTHAKNARALKVDIPRPEKDYEKKLPHFVGLRTVGQVETVVSQMMSIFHGFELVENDHYVIKVFNDRDPRESDKRKWLHKGFVYINFRAGVHATIIALVRKVMWNLRWPAFPAKDERGVVHCSFPLVPL